MLNVESPWKHLFTQTCPPINLKGLAYSGGRVFKLKLNKLYFPANSQVSFTNHRVKYKTEIVWQIWALKFYPKPPCKFMLRPLQALPRSLGSFSAIQIDPWTSNSTVASDDCTSIKSAVFIELQAGLATTDYRKSNIKYWKNRQGKFIYIFNIIYWSLIAHVCPIVSSSLWPHGL